ncbi:hypothetical protein [Rhodoblastus sp.]|uniref:hypothetical protein n=1 Tax=Rhodoblastus sp. TaxID=1962975 RepID=UPI003F96BA8B
MKTAIAMALALGVWAMSPAVAASSETTEPTHHHHRHHYNHRQAVAPAPHLAPAVAAPAGPSLRPYPPGEGDTDGLSRDPDDCKTGCIGGNPG